MIEAVLVAIIASGLGIVLTFMFTRNREVNALAQQNIASTKATFEIIETLKTVAFLQSQRIDKWENWGREIQYPLTMMRETLRGHGWNGIPEIPVMPDLHLDLRPYWRHLDEVIDGMNTDILPKEKK